LPDGRTVILRSLLLGAGFVRLSKLDPMSSGPSWKIKNLIDIGMHVDLYG